MQKKPTPDLPLAPGAVAPHDKKTLIKTVPTPAPALPEGVVGPKVTGHDALWALGLGGSTGGASVGAILGIFGVTVLPLAIVPATAAAAASLSFIGLRYFSKRALQGAAGPLLKERDRLLARLPDVGADMAGLQYEIAEWNEQLATIKDFPELRVLHQDMRQYLEGRFKELMHIDAERRDDAIHAFFQAIMEEDPAGLANTMDALTAMFAGGEKDRRDTILAIFQNMVQAHQAARNARLPR